jgi:excinuclease ABC subunit A
MVDRVMALPEGTRLYLLAPVVRGRKGEYRKELAEWQRAGFTRVRIDGQFHDIEDAPALDKKYKHDIEVVVDRLVVREGIETRLADSLEQALKLAEGLVYLDPADKSPSPSGEGLGVGDVASAAPEDKPHPNPSPEGEGLKKAVLQSNAPPGRITFSEKFACPVSGFTIAEIEPRLFSFNAPQGACRPATASARSSSSIPSSSFPTRTSASKRARSSPGPSPTRRHLTTCRSSAASPAL